MKTLHFLSNALLIAVSVLAVFVAVFGVVAIEDYFHFEKRSYLYGEAAFLSFALMWPAVVIFMFVKLVERLTR